MISCIEHNACVDDVKDKDGVAQYEIIGATLNHLFKQDTLKIRNLYKGFYSRKVNVAHDWHNVEDSVYFTSLLRQVDSLKFCILVRDRLELSNPNTRNQITTLTSENFRSIFPSLHPSFKKLLFELGKNNLPVQVNLDSLTTQGEFAIHFLYHKRNEAYIPVSKFLFSSIAMNAQLNKACLYAEVKGCKHPFGYMNYDDSDYPKWEDYFEGHYIFLEKKDCAWVITYDKVLPYGNLALASPTPEEFVTKDIESIAEDSTHADTTVVVQ